MKYKVGDRVRVRSDLKFLEVYGGASVNQRMKEMGGTVVTIASNKRCLYKIEEDDYFWTDEMFEGMASEDVVNHPAHYTDGKIEVIDFIRDKKLDFCRGNVVKYICRAGKKSKETELEDLKKAMQYCQFAIDELEGRNGN